MKVNCNLCKKRMPILFILVLCVCIFLTACGNTNTQNEENNPSENVNKYSKEDPSNGIEIKSTDATTISTNAATESTDAVTESEPLDVTTAPVPTDAKVDTPLPEPITTIQTEAATEATTPQLAFMEGTYYGSIEKFVDAMNSTIRYDATVVFQNGNYNYTVDIILSGTMEYSGQETYSGSYSVNGNSMTMTGNFSSGEIYGNSVTITGKLSNFAGQQESITVTQA